MGAITKRLYSNRWALLWGGLLLIVVLPIFIAAGLWQWNKGQAKLDRQAELDSQSHGAPVPIPLQATTPDALNYRHFILHGEYDVSHQVLIDNRVSQGQAGYHVITPLKLAGTDMHILVNRGWVPAPANHSQVPQVPPPAGPITITGIATVPSDRFFTLAPTTGSGTERVWQNLDLARFKGTVSYPLQPVVILLDADAPGGYDRDWPRPDDRAERNLGYAFQWFGFAVASVFIWLYFVLRRP